MSAMCNWTGRTIFFERLSDSPEGPMEPENLPGNSKRITAVSTPLKIASSNRIAG